LLKIVADRIVELSARPAKPILPPNLPDEFWNSSDLLKGIRAYAHFRYASADAVLANLLARVAAYMPDAVKLRTVVSERTSLNFFSAIVGESEAGKSHSDRVAKEIYPGDEQLGFIEHPVGSGEGIAEAFMGWQELPLQEGEKRPKKVKMQVRHNALFSADEGRVMMGIMKRPDDTLGAVLCSAFTGEVIGNKNASEERNRFVSKYSLGVRANFQPSIIAPLIDQFGIGLPSRFIFLSATDPAAETRCGFRADYPTIRPPKIVGPIYCDKSIHDFAHERRKLSLCGKIVSKPLERHYLLLRYKIAALLAYIEGRSKVEIIDWDRAEIIWRTSQEVLEFCLEEVEEQREAAAAEKGHSTALMQAAIKEAPPRIEEIAERIRAFLRKHPDVSNRQLRDACVNAKRGERPLFSTPCPTDSTSYHSTNRRSADQRPFIPLRFASDCPRLGLTFFSYFQPRSDLA
jgi:hypothetical protein